MDRFSVSPQNFFPYYTKLAAIQYCIGRGGSFESFFCKSARRYRQRLGTDGALICSIWVWLLVDYGLSQDPCSTLDSQLLHFWPYKTLPSSLGGGENVRSIAPDLCSSGALEFSPSPLQGFSASKTSWKLFRSENPALSGQSFCKYYDQELMLIWKKKKTKPVGFFQLAVQQLCISSLILLNVSAVYEACLELWQMWKIWRLW